MPLPTFELRSGAPRILPEVVSWTWTTASFPGTENQRGARAPGVLRHAEQPDVEVVGRKVHRLADLELEWARDKMNGYSTQGGSDEGCGLPGLVGETFRTNVARALLLDVEVLEADGDGDLMIWPGRDYSVPEVGLVQFDRTTDTIDSRSSVIAMTCYR